MMEEQIKEIQTKLRIINPETFQGLMNEFISYDKNIQFIDAPGSNPDKIFTTKGAPDAYFINEKGMYVLAEYTTLQSSENELCKKLKKDIDHCLSAIDNSKISEIILAFTNKILIKRHKLLNDYLKEINPKIKLTFYSLQNLGIKLSNFPNLNKYIPSVSIFDGIETIKGFIENSNDGFKPNLKNPFVETEDYNNCLNLLEKNKILIIHGKQGMGKSRLSLEIAKYYFNNGFKVYMISKFNNDLESNFSKILNKNDKFFIVIDNYSINFDDFENLIKFLTNKSNNIKILISVKESFLDNIQKRLNNYIYKCYRINNLNHFELEKIIDNYLKERGMSIKNNYKDKLIEVSKGNPNLVMMALYPKVDQNIDKFISKPINIYNKYFADFIKISISDIEYKFMALISGLSIC